MSLEHDPLSPLIKEISDFLEQILSKDKYDFVVARERSGDRLYAEAARRCLKTKVPRLPAKAIFSYPLQGKTILLFDDSVRSGNHMQRTAEDLRIRNAKVRTAAYMIHESCEHPVDFYEHKLSEVGYIQFCDRVSRYMRFLDYPLDSDHIYIIGRIETDSLTELEMTRLLSPLGQVYASDPVDQANVPIYKLSLFPNFFDPNDLGLPPYVLASNTWKIRFLFTREGYVCIFPLTFFEISHSAVPSKHENFPICLCEKHRSNPWIKNQKNPDELLTCYCIVFHSSTQLLGAFLKKWKRVLHADKMNLRIEKCVYEDGEFIFNDPSLSHFLRETVESSLSGT